jgi:hypothetical protein
MRHRKLVTGFLIIGALLVILTAAWLASAGPAKAQCGSAVSSCKNCHEVQAQDPVNNDGKPWHVSHAFGDFCAICHAGNSQSMDENQAHTGMVPPLSDVQAACQQCHAADLQERAQVYASLLGVEVGSGTTTTGGSTTTTTTTTTTMTTPVASAPVTTELQVDDANLVDYVQRYNEIVLGKHPVNWGNVILIAMIAMLVLGGGAFVVYNEKLVNVSFGEIKKVEGEYPADVVEILPVLAKLTPKTRKSLKAFMADPRKVQKTIDLIDLFYPDKE